MLVIVAVTLVPAIRLLFWLLSVLLGAERAALGGYVGHWYCVASKLVPLSTLVSPHWMGIHEAR